MLLSFVMLTYNSGKYVQDSIRGIIDVMDGNAVENYEIIVVDNGSTDDTRTLLEQSAGNGKLRKVHLDRNNGTTVSRNIALRLVRGKYICIMDSDVIIRKWEVGESLRYMDQNPCLLAPRLCYPDGRVQHSVKKFPTMTAKLLKLLKIFFAMKTYANRDFYPEFPFQQGTPVETAISAFWLFPAKILSAVGLLDENIFYSPEDIDYCVRIQLAGYPIYYYPLIEAIHHTQQISHRNPFSRLSLSHFFGLLYYFRKHRYFLRADRLREMIIRNKTDRSQRQIGEPELKNFTSFAKVSD